MPRIEQRIRRFLAPGPRYLTVGFPPLLLPSPLRSIHWVVRAP